MASTETKVGSTSGWLWSLLVIISTGLVLTGMIGSCVKQARTKDARQTSATPMAMKFTGPDITTGEEDVNLRVDDTRRLFLEEQEWSPWITLPPWAHCKLSPPDGGGSNNGGWIQYWFLSKEKPENPSFGPVWYRPGAATNTFRVRGTKCTLTLWVTR